MSLKKTGNITNTLLFRLTVLYAGIFTLSTLLILILFYFKLHTVTMKDLDEEFLGEVDRYSTIMIEKGLEGVKNEIAGQAEREDPEEEFSRLLTFQGEVLISTDISSWGAVEKSESLETLRSGDAPYVFQSRDAPDTDYRARVITAPIGPDVVVQIGETLEEAEDYLQIFLNWFLFLFFIMIVLSSLTGWFMARRALLDMEDVTETALEISKGDYDRRVQVKDRFNEIKRLGSTFNTMLDRIQSLLKSTREVNANIAHDLRSPLTRIRGIAEMSLMNDKSVEEYKGVAASTIEECDRLIEIVNTMLEITEAESGISEPRIEVLDVAPLIREACDLFQPIASEKKIEIVESLPAELTFHGDRKKLQRIISNLLDNAIKYTPEGGAVSITAGTESNRINIAFEDTGIGIPDSDLPHIFERFYQGDKSRSLGGVGLGLSLVKAFTEAMKGTVSVFSTVHKGSRFVVTFPQ